MNRDLIIQNEGGILSTGYVPMKGNRPATDGSGVTISSGIDLGHQDERSLKAFGASPELIKKLKPYLGKKGKEAVDFLKKNPLKITDEEARALSDGKFSAYESRARQSVVDSGGDWDSLPDVLKTGIVDVMINTGSLGRNTLKSIVEGDYNKIADNFDNYFGKDTEAKLERGELAPHNVQRVKNTAQSLRDYMREQELAELEELERLELEELERLERESEQAQPIDTPPVSQELAATNSTDPTYGAGHTAARMAAQGATFGFGDELGGAIQAGFGKVADLVGATNPYRVDQELLDQGFTGDLQPSAYEAGLQDERDMISTMREERPGLSFAAEAAGGVLGDLAIGGNPIAGGALYGFGEGEGGLSNRALGAGAGAALGAAIPAAGARVAPYAGRAAKTVGNAAADLVAPVSKSVADRFNHQIAPGIKNIYTAISGNIQQQDVAVLEAMTRQKDLFFDKPVKQNTKAAQATIAEEMTKLNKELAAMTKQISEETGDQVLMQFDVVADRLRREADLSGSENLRRLADKFDDAVLSGDYQEILKVYKDNVRNRRQYTPDGRISRYKGSNSDIIEEIDMLFENTNRAFIDDMARVIDFDLSTGEMNPIAQKFGSQFGETMSRLRDLHIVDNHLDKASRYVRKSGIDSVQLRDSLIGGALGGAIGGAAGMDPYTSGIAGVYLGATGRRSIAINNILGNLKNRVSPLGSAINTTRGLASRSVQGAVDLAANFGDDLLEMGVDQMLLSQLAKSYTSGITNPAETEQAAVALMQAAPELFEQGMYASEVGGRVTSPEDLAKEQVRINMVLKGNSIEKAKALSALNRDGTIYKPTDSERPSKLIKPVKSTVMPQAEVQEAVDADRQAELEELAELEAIFGAN